MGMCKPSGGIKSVYGPYRKSAPKFNTPNTRIDYYDEQSRELLQQRWYGPDGMPIWDRDWNHNNSNHSHTFPHDHSWDWTKNPAGRPVQPHNNNYC